jgi:hypothetical protein
MNGPELEAISILPPHERHYVAMLAIELRDPNQTMTLVLSSLEIPTRTDIAGYQENQNVIAQRCHRITTNLVIKNAKGEVLLVYRPRHHRDAHSIINRTAEALTSFLAKRKVMAPDSDIRHTGLDRTKLDQLYGQGNYGTVRCACWFEEGKPHDGPMVSREMLTGSRTFATCCKLIADLGPLKHQLSLLYAAASPVSWRNCVDRFAKLRKYIPATRVLTLSEIDPWCSLALVANIPSNCHRDVHDARHHLSALACSGDFGSSWMVLYCIRARLQYTPSDGLLLNTFLLPHFVQTCHPKQEETKNKTNPQRFGLSFFNHQSVLAWIKEEHARRNTNC